MTQATSTDQILGGRVLLRQPAQGYRTAIDPVLLAAAVCAKPGERVFDAGCGTGAASLCLAARVPGAEIFGIDTEPEFIALARESGRLNRFEPAPAFEIADLKDYGSDAAAARFDHVMSNPPFRASGSGQAPAHPLKMAAHVEGTVCLNEWIERCFGLLRPGGCFTMIHSQDRLPEVRTLTGAHAASGMIHPLWPKRRGAGCKRFIVQAVKPAADGSAGAEALRVTNGLVLHQGNGAYTDAADQILKSGAGLGFNFP
jgi:tRNA1(Val) A37 N6-methylase TrmN6